MTTMLTVKSCPFCGSPTAPSVWDSDEAFEDYDMQRDSSLCYQVVCNVNNGGCGSAGGWGLTKENAMRIWNRRAMQ